MEADLKFQEFKEKLSKNKYVDIDKITQAYILANEAHKGQKRKSGEDYIIHPIEVAEILFDMKLDTDTIIAGLLHDVVEDTMVTLADIEYSFNKDVAMLVNGVTKLRNLPKKQGKQIENVRKMVVAMSEDVRVVIIKLADRLHNMRTLEFQTPEKQIIKAKETLDIFVPIAHRIGMGKIKTELEDISFKYIYNKEYKEIEKLLNLNKIKREGYINKLIKLVDAELKKNNIKAVISGRNKSFYSIYKKMYEKNKKFNDLMDLTAIRIITEKEVDCYSVLGIAHSMFEPIEGRFKDYIAVPKENGYQSIHTTVKGMDKQIIEIQIRTEQMHEIAEDGVAAHWKYKEKKNKDKNEQYYAAVRKIIEANVNENNFAKEVTVQILKKTIFVFTPKGDVVELQLGSTVLDFAFQVHTQIGYKTIGAKVNDRIVTLDHVVKNGDKIEILTSKTAKGPGKDWINFAFNPNTKSKIKKWFKDQEFEMKAVEGEALLNEEFLKIGLKFKDYEDDDRVLLYMKKFNIHNLKQLFYKFANNELSIETFISKFSQKETLSLEQVIDDEKSKTSVKYNEGNKGIKVTGSDNTLFNFAKCCSPLPGDEIKGFITRVRGLVIHRSDCDNFKKLVETEPSREIEVSWDENLVDSNKLKYQMYFTIKTYGRSGLLLDIMRLLNEYKIDLTGINTTTSKENGAEVAYVQFGILVKKKEDFEKLSKHLLSMKDIVSIIRK